MNIFSARELFSSGGAAIMGQANFTSNGTDFLDDMLTQAGRVSPLMHVLAYVYRLLQERFGIDPSLVITVLGFAWGVSKMLSQVLLFCQGLIDTYLKSSVTVTQDDPIYNHLMKWMSVQPAIKNDRYLMAQTEYTSAWEETDETEGAITYSDAGDGTGEPVYLNFSSQAARSTPRFVPAIGSTRFYHNGTYFKVSRRKESIMNMTDRYGGAMKDVEEIRIGCFGRSVDPIKRLLWDAKQLYYSDTDQRTTIYRPVNKEYRREWHMWQRVACRPIRPMRTVVLNDERKHEVLQDINEYLHPKTPAWYASRGIPLRRGYLFHGPPGTGKTSFSFAIAGVFGIDIYVISLQDVNVTEEDLAALFAKLPRRCIVLLEDIDSAGLKRTEDQVKELEGKKSKDSGKIKAKKESENGEKGQRSLKTVVEEAVEEEVKVNGESHDAVSGTQNGAFLEDTPTTNDDFRDAKSESEAEGKDKSKKKKKKKSKKNSKKSRKHDSDSSDSSSSNTDSSSDEEAERRRRKRKSDAKMRKKRYGSGRRGRSSTSSSTESISLSGLLNAIDGVASHEGRVLIMTTNKPESLDEALVRPGRVDMQVGFSNASDNQACELFRRMYEAKVPALITAAEKKSSANEETTLSSEDLGSLAERFGDLVPQEKFSPAEIQGFLLKRKTSPRRAFEEAQAWVEATLKQKEAKSKIVTVQ